MEVVVKYHISMVPDKECKHSLRYKETGADPIIGTLYLKRSAFKDEAPPNVLDVVISSEGI